METNLAELVGALSQVANLERALGIHDLAGFTPA
jgi:hypothetical protein